MVNFFIITGTPLCCVGWAWRTALMVPCWAGSGPTSAVVRSSSAAAPLGRFQRLCHAVSRRARSLGRFCSCCIPQIYWGSSKDMTSFLICMPTTHRSAATHLHRMPCSCRRRFQDASMGWMQGGECSGVHPFDGEPGLRVGLYNGCIPEYLLIPLLWSVRRTGFPSSIIYTGITGNSYPM